MITNFRFMLMANLMVSYAYGLEGQLTAPPISSGQPLCMVNSILEKEKSLIGTCSKSCPELNNIRNYGNCELVSNCTLHREGGLCGTHRDDWCECMCYERCKADDSCKTAPIEGGTIVKDFLEAEITDENCKGKCEDHEVTDDSALIHGCFKISNCVKKKHGWTRWIIPFNKCDVCTCECQRPSRIESGMQIGQVLGYCESDNDDVVSTVQ